jgi:ribosomal protein L40E
MAQACRQCGSERIAPSVPVAPSAPPGSLLGLLRARVCADCGHTQLQTENAMSVYLAWQRESAGLPPPVEAQPATNRQCPRCGSLIPAAATTCDVCGWSSTDAPA